MDLAAGRVGEVALPEESAAWLGGRGLAGWLLRREGEWREGRVPLVLAIGPLAAYGAPCSSRATLASRSPLTGTYFDSSAGGALAARLASCGVAALLIRGRAPEPLVVRVTPGGVLLESASRVWTATVPEFAAATPSGASFAAIGPAAEHVLYANVMVDTHHAFGRGGLGRLMAQRNLKAIVVEGPLRSARPASPKRYRRALAAVRRLFTASPAVKALSRFGTPFLTRIVAWTGALPVRNFAGVRSPDAQRFDFDDLCAESVERRMRPRSAGCAACPIRCKRRFGDEALPEYETLAMLGASCGVADYEAVRAAAALANAHGVDTVSLGGTLATHFELTNSWPTGRGLVETVEDLLRRGNGTEGLEAGAARYAAARDADEAAMCVKGLELPGYDPRAVQGMALAYASSTRGGCHLRAYMVAPEILRKPRPLSRTTLSGKAAYLAVLQDRMAAADALGVCKFAFLGASEEEYAELLSAAVGESWGGQDLMRLGAKVYAAEMKTNATLGFGAAHDTLPERFFREPLERSGPVDEVAFRDELATLATVRAADESR